MLSMRKVSRFSRWIVQVRLSSALPAFNERKTSAFSVVDPSRLQLKPAVRLKGRRFLPGADSITFPEYLDSPRDDFPLALEAVGTYSIEDWGRLCKEEADTSLLAYGAILFRGLPLESADDFQLFFSSTGYRPMNYIGGSAHRKNVMSQVYSASDEPPECCIDLHNEMSYSRVYNKRFFFFCLLPPEKGGVSVICKNADLFAQLDQKYIEKIVRKKIRYIRHCPDGATSDYLSWQKVFHVSTKKEAEEEMTRLGVEWEWQKNNDLTYWYLLDAMQPHFITGEEIWFNQAHAMHASFFKAHPSFYQKNIPDNQYPFHSTYGDGEEFEPDFLRQIRDAGWRSAVGIPWAKGDVLLLDNMLVQHARLDFEGQRKILVALSN